VIVPVSFVYLVFAETTVSWVHTNFALRSAAEPTCNPREIPDVATRDARVWTYSRARQAFKPGPAESNVQLTAAAANFLIVRPGLRSRLLCESASGDINLVAHHGSFKSCCVILLFFILRFFGKKNHSCTDGKVTQRRDRSAQKIGKLRELDKIAENYSDSRIELESCKSETALTAFEVAGSEYMPVPRPVHCGMSARAEA
jgi:hypothetical protein